MWGSSLHLDKFEYAKTNPRRVKILGILGVICTLFMAYGFWNFLKLNPLYLFIFGPITGIFIVNKVMRYTLQLFYQRFDVKKHKKFIQEFWSKNKEPSVDVFLPWAGEDLAMHEQVVKAVSELNYKNLNIYMLDDVGSLGHQELASKYGAHYLSRPNKGENKKSGNLQYGYDHSGGEFVFILDADFIPIKEALREVIPYIASDDKIGILQTPQYFEQTKQIHNKSKIEFGGGNIVEEFYRIVMPCRDEFRAAMCVGTSAVYRKTAIQKLHGTPKVHASEDLATGFLITEYGYYVKYLPLIISMGKSPDTFQGYFKQHMRWCSGNLVFIKYWPRAHLNPVARLIYLTNPMYYLSEALTVVFAFQFLVLLYFHTDSLSIWNTLYFLPYMILSRLVSPLTKTNKSKLGTKMAALSNSYTYFYTYIRMLIKGIPSWHPTGKRMDGLHKDFLEAVNIGTVISALYIFLFIVILISKPQIFANVNTYVVLGWSFYSVFWHVLFLSFVAEFIYQFKAPHSKSFTEKAYLFTKKHIVLTLFVVLISSATLNIVLALGSKPISTQAVSRNVNILLAQEHVVFDEHAISEAKKKRVQVVLAASTSAAQKLKEKTYSYTVNPGDSELKLAKLAVTQYMDENFLSLSDNQINIAAYRLYLARTTSGNLQIGNKVSFSELEILDVMEEVIAKSESDTIYLN